MSAQLSNSSALRRALFEADDLRKQAEASLIASEKVATLGRLVSAVMHEINNPLSAILDSLWLLKESEQLDAESKELIDTAHDEIIQVIRIAKNTLSFTKESTKAVELDLTTILESVLELLAPKIVRNRVAIDRRYASSECRVVGFPGELRQVFVNLIANAVEAMGSDGGTLTLHLHKHQDGFAVAVSDSGPGMSREAIKKFGKPFFTTKGEAGNGLGLWVSSDIVGRHGGRIKVRNKKNSGAVFSVFLPLRTMATVLSLEKVA